MNPLKLLKAVSGNCSMEELQDLAAEFGIRFQVQEISDAGHEAAFCELAEAAMRPGAQLVLLRARGMSGGEIKILAVMGLDRPAPDADLHVENGEARSARPLLPCPVGQNFD